ncbi:MAG: TerB family tellurite resistance protein [Proteobacteria bacterium]|nr:TerB family tellurite resistance protein [Pseudomonadota bacterium]
MSIWGKILGGGLGFAVGGPLGALVGALLGAQVDRGIDQARGKITPEATRQITFTIGVIALSAKMAKADGHVTREEVDAFKRIFQIPPHEAKNVGRIFDMARQDSAGYEAYASQIARMFKDSPAVLEDLLGALFHIAMADGVYHSVEDAYLQNVARIFGFSETEFEHIKAQHTGDAAQDPYNILGVSTDVSDAELKRIYRTLIKEHHPDRLIAKGMPEEFIAIANEKLAAINTAYDRIAKERGLN